MNNKDKQLEEAIDKAIEKGWKNQLIILKIGGTLIILGSLALALLCILK